VLTVAPPAVEAERIEDFKCRTRTKVEKVRCPIHHQPPRLHFRGTTLREMTISMSGCCDRLIEIANKAIAS
jgi:hypothetical protein